ncbi:tautomerase family protein [Enterococcus sp. AZ072]
MPYITIESVKLSKEQKEELIKQLTDVSSQIMRVPKDFFSITIK